MACTCTFPIDIIANVTIEQYDRNDSSCVQLLVHISIVHCDKSTITAIFSILIIYRFTIHFCSQLKCIVLRHYVIHMQSKVRTISVASQLTLFDVIRWAKQEAKHCRYIVKAFIFLSSLVDCTKEEGKNYFEFQRRWFINSDKLLIDPEMVALVFALPFRKIKMLVKLKRSTRKIY